MSEKLFPENPCPRPTIYAYEDKYNPETQGMLKVGFTTVGAEKRVKQQYNITRPGEPPYRIVFEEPAMRSDGTSFHDHEVHEMLVRHGIQKVEGEWFRCKVGDVRRAWKAVRERTEEGYERTASFGMRAEQRQAVEKAANYFKRYNQEEESGRTPHFLWNCKMRFGKTFATYQLALRMGWRRVLVLTFKPAVSRAWEEDLMTHEDFAGWQFLNSKTQTEKDIDLSRPFVCFGSFQDFLGKTRSGGMKEKHAWTRAFNWDCVVLDEYHYGAWRDDAQALIGSRADESDLKEETENPDYFDEDTMPITARHYLYLSGTPFRALESGEFIEEEIFNWTYSDEQRAKENWDYNNGANPYEQLPRMVMLTYQLPDSIAAVARDGEFNEFDLNTFFSATGEGDDARFVHHDDVQHWLDLLRGNYLPSSVDQLKKQTRRPPLPFYDSRLYETLNHTLWFLPNVASCYAMRNLIMERQNTFYHDYHVTVCAGSRAGIGSDALGPVELAMQHPDPLHCKSITLSCGKLTTGVTVRPWTGIFMLRDTSSPETYFQAAFRVQSPWTLNNADGLRPNETLILKRECYIFDFSPNRALRKLAEYSNRLDTSSERSAEEKVDDLVHFLPVLCYDDGVMRSLDAGEILDMAMSNTSATLLARRWESATLVNVGNGVLERLLNNDEAMTALMKIEGFRKLNEDIKTIITVSDDIKKKKKKGDDISKKEKKELTDKEKEIQSKRKMIQEKLIKFATRIPVFMYLTDYRERSLRDVIMGLEPSLFQKVTGLSKNDFELLVGLGVFNETLMNDAVFKFKRYEDSSLTYSGIDRHEDDEHIGGWNTSVRREEFYAEPRD